MSIFICTNENIHERVQEYLAGNPNNYPQINDWDVSNVTDMNSLFTHTFSFNQPLNNWDVSNVTDMHFMFLRAESFNQPLNNWNVSNVTDMYGMFTDARSFNQPLNNWNVSNVTDMGHMFNSAESFNRPLNNWDVSNVTDMRGMFFRCPINEENKASPENYEKYLESKNIERRNIVASQVIPSTALRGQHPITSNLLGFIGANESDAKMLPIKGENFYYNRKAGETEREDDENLKMTWEDKNVGGKNRKRKSKNRKNKRRRTKKNK